jgi:hypothetical protein
MNGNDTIYLQPHVESGNKKVRVISTIYPKSSSSQKIISDALVMGWADSSTTDSRASHVLDVRDSDEDSLQDIDYDLDVVLSAADSTFHMKRAGVIIELI